MNFKIRDKTVNQIGELTFVFPERLKTLDTFNLTLEDLRYGDYFELNFTSFVDRGQEA